MEHSEEVLEKLEKKGIEIEKIEEWNYIEYLSLKNIMAEH